MAGALGKNAQLPYRVFAIVRRDKAIDLLFAILDNAVTDRQTDRQRKTIRANSEALSIVY